MKNFLATVKARLLGWGAAAILALLDKTLRWKIADLRSDDAPLLGDPPKIFAFWHGRQILMPLAMKRLKSPSSLRITALASRHTDGRIVATALKAFGIDSVAGSSSRGGKEALKELCEAFEAGSHLAITPDGPRGPARVCKPGVAILGIRTEGEIYPVSYGAQRTWKLSSWDGMIIPKPFSKVVLVIGDKMPNGAASESVEDFSLRIQKELNKIEKVADNYFNAPADDISDVV
ncbi:MAG: DUF374 domain-containing protein [Candidatus Dadabacteria bacterium]|nr:MAG: DUF374 domain-containing protein [Candidatus Dadabacteria bacterium]